MFKTVDSMSDSYFEKGLQECLDQFTDFWVIARSDDTKDVIQGTCILLESVIQECKEFIAASNFYRENLHKYPHLPDPDNVNFLLPYTQKVLILLVHFMMDEEPEFLELKDDRTMQTAKKLLNYINQRYDQSVITL